jgi:hypothetical protein
MMMEGKNQNRLIVTLGKSIFFPELNWFYPIKQNTGGINGSIPW